MKKYNVKNYIRYKVDLTDSIHSIELKELKEYTREELIVMFLPLVENIGRKFATSQQASGVMSINDLIQEGSLGLIRAVDKIIWETIEESNEPEKTIKSFLSKRIKGAIRRAIDINRGDIRIPEHKLNEIRKDNGKNHKMVAMFFNSIFLSIDEQINEDEDGSLFQIPDQSEPYNIGLMNIYLQSLLKKHLNKKEYEILRLSYGLDCDKHSANQIADILSIEGPSAYVRISEIKKEAVKKLIENVESNQIFDYL
jgi:RNA polymerase sigma factor (sigma-70 family)|tara:strand:+ start:422 stop:1183 length:762 start_codon:yes stop_codon:yes gene_type:complete